MFLENFPSFAEATEERSNCSYLKFFQLFRRIPASLPIRLVSVYRVIRDQTRVLSQRMNSFLRLTCDYKRRRPTF